MLPTIIVEQTTITLPESKKQIKIRPILVREEQIILMGYESENTSDFFETVVQVTDSCIVSEGYNSNNMSLVDFCYTYTKLREISKGTSFPVDLFCQHCKNENNEPTKETKSFQIDKILKIVVKDVPKLIKITENYALALKPLTVHVYKKTFIDNIKKPLRSLYRLCIIELLDSVLQGEERIPVIDGDKEKIIDALTSKQFDKIEEWFLNQSSIYCEFEWTCKKCGHEQTAIEADIIHFFDLA